MTGAKRIQLSRRRGWRKPEGAIVVSRPSKWGNPFTVASCIENGFADADGLFDRATTEAARAVCVEAFASWMRLGTASNWWFADGRYRWDWMDANLHTLRGHDLACWCPLDGGPCHADVLLELANQ